MLQTSPLPLRPDSPVLRKSPSKKLLTFGRGDGSFSSSLTLLDLDDHNNHDHDDEGEDDAGAEFALVARGGGRDASDARLLGAPFDVGFDLVRGLFEVQDLDVLHDDEVSHLREARVDPSESVHHEGGRKEERERKEHVSPRAHLLHQRRELRQRLFDPEQLGPPRLRFVERRSSGGGPAPADEGLREDLVRSRAGRVDGGFDFLLADGGVDCPCSAGQKDSYQNLCQSLRG